MLKRGDKIIITIAYPRHKVDYAATIDRIDSDGYVYYSGRYGSKEARLPSGQGRFHPDKLGQKPFGCQAVRKEED